MQLLLRLDDGPITLQTVHTRLLARFGKPGPWLHLDPVSQFAMGMIGGRTREQESRAAFEALSRRFRDWEAVRDAPCDVLRAAIAPVNFAERKAPRMQAALRAITMLRRRIELDFLRDLPVDAALAWLEQLPGVGRKVSAATLNFSTLRMRSLVVDTHHLRIVRRLGLIRPHATYEEAYRRLMPRLPEHWTASELDDHHQLLKRLGQTVCRHEAPRCDCCPLRDLCPSRRRNSMAMGTPSRARPGFRPDAAINSQNQISADGEPAGRYR